MRRHGADQRDLRENVPDRMADGWSAEQICGRLALDAGHRVIGHETIYRFVHAQLKRTNDVSWRRYLLRGSPGSSPGAAGATKG